MNLVELQQNIRKNKPLPKTLTLRIGQNRQKNDPKEDWNTRKKDCNKGDRVIILLRPKNFFGIILSFPVP